MTSNTVSQLRFVEVSVGDVATGFNGGEVIKEETTMIAAELPDVGFNYTSSIEIATKIVSR